MLHYRKWNPVATCATARWTWLKCLQKCPLSFWTPVDGVMESDTILPALGCWIFPSNPHTQEVQCAYHLGEVSVRM